MSNEHTRSVPTVILPFSPAPPDSDARDIFVYLRPETNGVKVESSLLRVIERCERYRQAIELVYLANIPGEFMTRRRLIEEHYCYKIPFARDGKRHFTESMRTRFEEHFHVPFADARILGAFEALDVLDITPEEMFELWVAESDLLNTNCQSIKRIDEVYVVNYDIPALLCKYTEGTDIAVMMFRSRLTEDEFEAMIDAMSMSLRSQGIIGEHTPRTRAFHVSEGPFEQILDARGHLFTSGDTLVEMGQIQFCRFLQDRGVHCREIEKALHFPIMQFRTANGSIVEDCLYEYTHGDSYEVAYQKFRTATAQFIIQ